MSDQLPDLVSRVRVDTTELDAAVRKGAAFGSAFGSLVGNIAGGAISAGIGKVTSFISGSVDAFAQLEDATAAAGVVFGKNVGDVTKFAKGAADSAGLSASAATDAALTFGTMGKSAGLAGGDLTGFSTEMAQLAGDMASFRGTTPEEAIEAVGAALRGETEPIRKYGVLLDDASLRQEAVRQGLIKTTKEALTPQQKVLAAHALILKQTSDAQGDFARTSDSTANTQKRLAAESANAQAQLGEKLAPAMTALRQLLLQLITGLDSVFAVLQQVAAVFATVAGFVQQNIDVIGPLAAILLVLTVQANAAAIATLAYNAASKAVAVATRVWAGVQAALNVVLAANPIGLVVLAIAALVAAIVIAYRNSETFRNIVNTAWHSVQTVVSAVVGAVVGFVTGLVDKVRGAWSAIRDATTGAWGAVRSFITGAVSTVVDFVRDHWRLLLGILTGPFGLAVALITGHWSDIRGAVSDGISRVMDLVRSLPGRIRDGLGDLGGILLHAGEELIQGLIDGITRKLGAIGDVMGKVADKIGGFLPGSPVREGPLTSWNRGGAGRRLGDLLADGIAASVGTVGRASALLASAVQQPGAGVGSVGAQGTAAGAGSTSRTWAPNLQVYGSSDPLATAQAAMDELTWQARLEGAPV